LTVSVREPLIPVLSVHLGHLRVEGLHLLMPLPHLSRVPPSPVPTLLRAIVHSALPVHAALVVSTAAHVTPMPPHLSVHRVHGRAHPAQTGPQRVSRSIAPPEVLVVSRKRVTERRSRFHRRGRHLVGAAGDSDQ
jgi:hypothetical protein